MFTTAWKRTALETIDLLLGSSPKTDANLVRIRVSTNTDRILKFIIVASMPAALTGAWFIGLQEIETVGTASGTTANPLLLGLSYVIPLLIISTLTCVAWEIAFATIRKRPVDPGWLMASWFFVLLLPHQTPLIIAAVGISFGIVFGKHVFGGTGRYIASPALLGALFLHYAYPPDVELESTWQAVATAGTVHSMARGIDWWNLFLGNEVSLIGTGSALACVLGAAALVVARIASVRSLLGAALGLTVAAAIAALIGNTLPAHWHFALGGFAFGWAFLLTDPTTLPLTRIGRWLHGASFGVLVVLLREADPSHPESTLFALLLASLMAPLIDYFVLRAHIFRSKGRLGVRK